MKDFRELLKIEQYNDYSEIKHSLYLEPYRLFKGIDIGRFTISIQASQNHYCTPRHTLNDIYKYEDMEIAIFEKDKWIQPHTDIRFKNFNRLDELLDRYEEGNIAVGGYVPVNLIQDLCNFLEKI